MAALPREELELLRVHRPQSKPNEVFMEDLARWVGVLKALGTPAPAAAAGRG